MDVSGVRSSWATMDRYWFRSPPAALYLLARSGVDVVSMANNHGADHGRAGLRRTLRAARDAPVAVVGSLARHAGNGLW